MGKYCCIPNVFIQIFRLLLKIFIMMMDSLTKTKTNSVK